jgi:ribosomal protein L30E
MGDGRVLNTAKHAQTLWRQNKKKIIIIIKNKNKNKNTLIYTYVRVNSIKNNIYRFKASNSLEISCVLCGGLSCLLVCHGLYCLSNFIEPVIIFSDWDSGVKFIFNRNQA